MLNLVKTEDDHCNYFSIKCKMTLEKKHVLSHCSALKRSTTAIERQMPAIASRKTRITSDYEYVHKI